jgi:hypothetical protein
MHRVVLLRAAGRNGVDIGTLGFWTFAGGLNIWGQVAGDSQVLQNSSTTFVYDAPVEVVLYSGGTLTGLDSVIGHWAVGQAAAINDFGVIVGAGATLYLADNTAGIYKDGVWYDADEVTTGLPFNYPDFLTICVAINNEGVILAISEPGNDPPTQSFILTPVKATGHELLK